MTDRPTLGEQIEASKQRARQRNRKPPPTQLQTTWGTLNAILSVWFLLNLVGLITAILGLVVLARWVF